MGIAYLTLNELILTALQNVRQQRKMGMTKKETCSVRSSRSNTRNDLCDAFSNLCYPPYTYGCVLYRKLDTVSSVSLLTFFTRKRVDHFHILADVTYKPDVAIQHRARILDSSGTIQCTVACKCIGLHRYSHNALQGLTLPWLMLHVVAHHMVIKIS